ncbi:MAG: AI-2E family transporter [Candidatus Wildermuthbacteria bacterium]|nr:AI-2E family transporter [Candidatus Wildermuthbacteria bacterium]
MYLGILVLISLAIYWTAPLFLQEIKRFAQLLPQYIQTIAPTLSDLGIVAFSDFESAVQGLTVNVEENSASIIRAVGAIFGGIFSTIFVISIAMFLSVEERSIERTLLLLFPKRYEAAALDVWRKSQRQVAGWFFSRVLSSLFVGAATYVALLLFDVRYPFILSLISGVLNFVPIIGPLIAGVLVGVVVAFDPVSFASTGADTLRLVFVILAMILIQQIESYILTPLLTKRFIGMPPALVLIALAVGGELWGVMGAILAIPLFGIVSEFLRDFLRRRKKEEAAIPISAQPESTP